MRAVPVIAALALLAACGADGEPTPPPPGQTSVGISLSGTAKIGVSF